MEETYMYDKEQYLQFPCLDLETAYIKFLCGGVTEKENIEVRGACPHYLLLVDN